MKTRTFILAFALALLAGCAANTGDKSVRACCIQKGFPTLETFTDKSLFQLDSTWTTDGAKPVRLAALRGQPQVLAMFFASCQFTCPLTIADLKRIEAALPESLRGRVGFTLVSFDSKRDTPEALRKLRKERGLTGGNWTLLRGGPDDVRELAALLGVSFRQDASGQFAHSNVITVLNAGGEILFQQAGLNLPPDEIVAKLAAQFHK